MSRMNKNILKNIFFDIIYSIHINAFDYYIVEFIIIHDGNIHMDNKNMHEYILMNICIFMCIYIIVNMKIAEK